MARSGDQPVSSSSAHVMQKLFNKNKRKIKKKKNEKISNNEKNKKNQRKKNKNKNFQKKKKNRHLRGRCCRQEYRHSSVGCNEVTATCATTPLSTSTVNNKKHAFAHLCGSVGGCNGDLVAVTDGLKIVERRLLCRRTGCFLIRPCVGSWRQCFSGGSN